MEGSKSFFFNDTATTEIYTLSLHDALPICPAPAALTPTGECGSGRRPTGRHCLAQRATHERRLTRDRKSTRLNSSHANISYAVFCLKKKNNPYTTPFLILSLPSFFSLLYYF